VEPELWIWRGRQLRFDLGKPSQTNAPIQIRGACSGQVDVRRVVTRLGRRKSRVEIPQRICQEGRQPLKALA
jgi:hypothetical protein